VDEVTWVDRRTEVGGEKDSGTATQVGSKRRKAKKKSGRFCHEVKKDLGESIAHPYGDKSEKSCARARGKREARGRTHLESLDESE